MFCSKCGKEINNEAIVCIHCGCAVKNNKQTNQEGKSWLTTLLLCFFLGGLGIHRFYTGHIATGIVQLLTAGCCGIWTLIDFILIIVGKFNSADDQPLQK